VDGYVNFVGELVLLDGLEGEPKGCLEEQEGEEIHLMVVPCTSGEAGHHSHDDGHALACKFLRQLVGLFLRLQSAEK